MERELLAGREPLVGRGLPERDVLGQLKKITTHSCTITVPTRV
jgi:hypothetical protein